MSQDTENYGRACESEFVANTRWLASAFACCVFGVMSSDEEEGSVAASNYESEGSASFDRSDGEPDSPVRQHTRMRRC